VNVEWPGGQAGGPGWGVSGWEWRAWWGAGGGGVGSADSVVSRAVGRRSMEARERAVTPASRGLTDECIQLLERAGSPRVDRNLARHRLVS